MTVLADLMTYRAGLPVRADWTMHDVFPSIIMVVGQPLMVLTSPQSRTAPDAAEEFVIGNPTSVAPSSENNVATITVAREVRTLR
jgi:hypothetical protein